MADLDREEIERELAAIRISKKTVAAVETSDGERFLVFEFEKQPAAIRLEDVLDGATPHVREIINRWFEGRRRRDGR